MSTLRVDNFGPSAGGTPYSARGVSRGWAQFDGGTVTAFDSLNLSSITDNGVGDYTFNHTNSFGSSAYTQTGTVVLSFVTTGVWNIDGVDGFARTAVFATGAFRANSYYVTAWSNRTNTDASTACVDFKGDLA